LIAALQHAAVAQLGALATSKVHFPYRYRLAFHSSGALLLPGQAQADVGMAAFLTATVRAPVTGMILIFEMTGALNQALPMLRACFAAVAVPTLMGNSPIYDAMKARTIGVARRM
jgi:CIC family chloride channel protein